MCLTVMRVPSMRGLPPQVPGVLTMRGSRVASVRLPEFGVSVGSMVIYCTGGLCREASGADRLAMEQGTRIMGRVDVAGLFFCGALLGFGVALVVVAHLLDATIPPLGLLGSVNVFLAGVVLVVVGLLGGAWVARGIWKWRLRALLGAVAMLAILLGLAVELRRRSERLGRLERRHRMEASRLEMALVDSSITHGQAVAVVREVHWHDGMSWRFRRAASRPWFPVPAFVSCDCENCVVADPG